MPLEPPDFGIDVSHRFGVEQHALEGVDGLDVGQHRAVLHRYADADLGEVDAAAGGDLRLLLEVTDDLRRDDGHVECFPALDALGERARRGIVEGDFVAGLALELGQQLDHHGAHGARRQHPDLGRATGPAPKSQAIALGR